MSKKVLAHHKKWRMYERHPLFFINGENNESLTGESTGVLYIEIGNYAYCTKRRAIEDGKTKIN